jgi:hypothetical protein
MRWILADVSSSKGPADRAKEVKVNILNSISSFASPMAEPFPAVGCLQDVFNFLSDLSKDDAEDFDAYNGLDILSLIPSDDEILYDSDAQSDENIDDDIDESIDGCEHYNLFLNKLRRNEAIEIVRSMRRFVNDIRIRLNSARSQSQSRFQLSEDDQNECIELIWKFLRRTVSQLREIPLYAHNKFVKSKSFELCCEKFLFIKLHDILFAGDAEDAQLDRKLKQRMKVLSLCTIWHRTSYFMLIFVVSYIIKNLLFQS